MAESKTPKRKPVKKDKRKKRRKAKTPKVSVRQKQDVRQSVKVIVEAPKPKPRRKRGTLQPKFSSIQSQQQRPQLTQIINERQALNSDFQDVLNIRLRAQETGLNRISNNLEDLERRLNPNIYTQNLTPPNLVPIAEPVIAEPITETNLDEIIARQKSGGFMDEPERPDLFSGSVPSRSAEEMYRNIRTGLRTPRDKNFLKRLIDHDEELQEIMEPVVEEPEPVEEQEEPEPVVEEQKEAEIQVKGRLKLSEEIFTPFSSGRQATLNDMKKFLNKNGVKFDKRIVIDSPSNRAKLEKKMISTLGINGEGVEGEPIY